MGAQPSAIFALDTPTNYSSVSSGSRHLQVEPSNSSTPVIDETVSLNSATNYTLITANFAASLTPIFLTDNQTTRQFPAQACKRRAQRRTNRHLCGRARHSSRKRGADREQPAFFLSNFVPIAYRGYIRHHLHANRFSRSSLCPDQFLRLRRRPELASSAGPQCQRRIHSSHSE